MRGLFELNAAAVCPWWSFVTVNVCIPWRRSRDLLRYVAMIESLLTLGIFWHVVQNLPGFLETLAYLYGMMAASFTIDLYLQRDAE